MQRGSAWPLLLVCMTGPGCVVDGMERGSPGGGILV
jgi:hypothetical protein